MTMHRRGRSSTMMVLLLTICLWSIVDGIKEIIVESPFYLRARVHDSQTASVQFEIAEVNDQRTCRMYKFTIRRNEEYPYLMPEQNLTFWRNSLELKHLAVGDYRICAIICSEHTHSSYEVFNKKNRSIPISACLTIHAYRSHFLVLTLYFLVFIILVFSQIIFTLRKRKFRARVKTGLIDVENAIEKWRSAQSTTDVPHTYSILQSLMSLPTVPLDHSMTSPCHFFTEEHLASHPVIFHLDIPREQSILEIP